VNVTNTCEQYCISYIKLKYKYKNMYFSFFILNLMCTKRPEKGGTKRLVYEMACTLILIAILIVILNLRLMPMVMPVMVLS